MSNEDEELGLVTSEPKGSDAAALSRRSMLRDALAIVAGSAVGATAMRPETLQGLRSFIVDDGLPADGGQDPRPAALAQAACNPPNTYNRGGGCNPQQGGCGTLSVCDQEVCAGIFSCVGGHDCTGERHCSSDTCAGDFNCGGAAGGIHNCSGAHTCTEASFDSCHGGFWPCPGFVTEPPDPALSRARDIRSAIAKKVA